jgi:hypothetical protein
MQYGAEMQKRCWPGVFGKDRKKSWPSGMFANNEPHDIIFGISRNRPTAL